VGVCVGVRLWCECVFLWLFVCVWCMFACGVCVVIVVFVCVW